jgi:hypothetical protein
MGPLKEAAPDGGGADEAQADSPTRATASVIGNVRVITEISFVSAYGGGLEQQQGRALIRETLGS